jgi:arginyl-tRNA--protein-N-Asp/Glu arginylyltransferase
MIMLQEPHMSIFAPCTYLPDRMWRFEYFFAYNINERELDRLLSRGWRKFGEYYFRPSCGDCTRCIPIRILAQEFKPSKGQRRVIRHCADVDVRFKALEYRDEIFEIYRDHSMSRFGKESDPDEFINAFYTPSCPTIQSEYYRSGELVAVGFIDISGSALSSVYFAYKTSCERLRLGTYSVLREVEHAASLGLAYYYLGYYIEENRSMEYKGHFHPHEKYDWPSRRWNREYK